jgi:hypothetical protein
VCCVAGLMRFAVLADGCVTRNGEGVKVKPYMAGVDELN